MFTEFAHTQHCRSGARGNVTMFPMPLPDVRRELHHMETHAGLSLPRTGRDLQQVVKALLKSSGKLPASLITQCTLPRQV
eukprot:11443475-Karenia_brevis.AAC.1